jgi:hypothetical protein
VALTRSAGSLTASVSANAPLRLSLSSLACARTLARSALAESRSAAPPARYARPLRNAPLPAEWQTAP